MARQTTWGSSNCLRKDRRNRFLSKTGADRSDPFFEQSCDAQCSTSPNGRGIMLAFLPKPPRWWSLVNLVI